MSKLTATQENFNKLNGRAQMSPSDMLEEESKSGHSGSRGGSIASRNFGSNSRANNKGKQGLKNSKGKNLGKNGAKNNKSGKGN
jgi:hypothetical protein